MTGKTLKKIVVVTLAVIGAYVILMAVVWGVMKWVGKGRVPSKTILEADFEKGVIEYVPDDPLARIATGRVPRMLSLVEALEKASTDDRVVGLIARLGGSELKLAQIQELRDAVMRFRAAGKTAVAFAETIGEVVGGNGAYYLATAFDEIHMQPSGTVGLLGLRVDSMFIRGTLDKLGFSPRLDHRAEYKTAKNFITERAYTPAHREAVEGIVQSLFGQMVGGIAQARKMSEEDVRALIDRGPFTAEEALEAKLVDGLTYRQELYEQVKERAGKGAELLYLDKYRERAGSPYEKGTTIALIYGVGGVQRGKSGYDPMFQEITMGADSVSAAFRAAVKDKKVKAILFRVDSPGGSYVASDTIWRETVNARKAGKPVIVSMGYVAGSGGYFVAMAADKIVAQPATITGSIGVVSGKFITTNFWDKLGISWDDVQTSANAGMWTGLEDFTPEQWQKMQDWLDLVYNDFTTKVAEGRNLPLEKVLAMAKGRVWTGEDAKTLGLVDELGGYNVALRLAREAAGIAPDAPVKLKLFPKRKTPLEMLLAEEPDSSEDATAAVLARVMQLVRPFARIAQESGLLSEPQILRMPTVEP